MQQIFIKRQLLIPYNLVYINQTFSKHVNYIRLLQIKCMISGRSNFHIYKHRQVTQVVLTRKFKYPCIRAKNY